MTSDELQHTVLAKTDDLRWITIHTTCQKGWPRVSYNTRYLSERMTSGELEHTVIVTKDDLGWVRTQNLSERMTLDELEHTVLVRKDDYGWVITHSTCQKGWPWMSNNTQYMSERMTLDELQHTVLVRKDDLGWITSLNLVLLWQLFYLFCSSIVINTVIVTAGTFEPYWQREVWRFKIWFNPPFL
jgi:hypothetical protein